MKHIYILISLIALGIVAFLFSSYLNPKNNINISSYEDCVSAGYPVLESYPEQCNTPDGQHFVRQLTLEESLAGLPKKLETKYTTGIDWPPKAILTNETYNCTVAGNETDRAGKTIEKNINNRLYCVTTVAEGAAGSIYYQYAYTTAYNEQTLALTFSVQQPQCDNYDEPQRSSCKIEQENFNPDEFIGKIQIGK